MTDLLNDESGTDMPGLPTGNQADPIPPLLPPTPGVLNPRASTPAPPTPPPFPPPTLPAAAPSVGSRRLLAAIAGLGIVSAVGMGVLWSGASSRADEANSGRVAAEAERDLATQRQLEADTEIATLRDEVERLDGELAAVPPPIDVAPLEAEIEALEAKIDELTEESERLATENAELEAALPAVPQDDPAPAVEPAVEAPELTEEFLRDIGESVSSRNGQGSVLGPGQTQCLGAGVIEQFGLDRVSAELGDGTSFEPSAELATTMEAVALGCGIDPSAVFAQ